MATFNNVLADATSLPIDERLNLVEAIWDSIPERELPPLSDEWREEIARRSAAFDAGEATTVDWETVREEALKRIERRSSNL